MSRENVNDMTDAFDVRLAALRNGDTPEAEMQAAIYIYERLRTAQSIVKALAPTNSNNNTELLISVFQELCSEAQSQSFTAEVAD
jgi:glutathionylspermidine synthase